MVRKNIQTENLNASESREHFLKSGALQNAIINSANFSSIATDEKGVIQLFNVGAERMLGYSAVDMVNKIMPANISDTDELILRAKTLSVEFDTLIKPGFEALVYKASHGIEDIYEITYICKDGSLLPAIVSVTALRNAQNTLIGYLLIGTDNTARKEIELKQERLDQQLLDQQLYVQSLLESISDALTVIDKSGIITDVNKQMELLTGCTRDELIGTLFANYFTNQKRAEAGLKRVLRQKNINNYELTIRAKNGMKTQVSYNVNTFYDREKKLQGVLATARDMTEQRQATLYARSLREASLDPLVTISSDGKITDVNEATVKVTGVKRAKLIGTDFSSYFTDAKNAREGYLKAFAKGRVTNYPLTMCDSKGRLTDVMYNASVYKNADGTTLGVFAAARDVTGSNTLAQMLEEKNIALESAKFLAEKANHAKSEFLFSMSHELRTPLNAILGFAQLMETDSLPPTPSQQDSIGQILKAGWHLLNLINEVLDLAKIESGEVAVSREPVCLATIMLECQGMIEPQSKERGISVAFTQPDQDYYAQADQTRVKQVLINLLSNAIKYNSMRGTVEVTYKASRPGHVRVSVRDTGAGLSPEDQAQLFQPFNRLGKEEGTEEGTGIGLVVSKRLIELMDGRMGSQSQMGEGSVFWFELPSVSKPLVMAKDEAVVTPPLPQTFQLTRPYTLLYVEDNIANMKLLKKIIGRYPDIQLLSAKNGTLGIELAHKHQPDVIVTDIDMPGITGFDFLKRLHSNLLTAHIPIIALSANAMPKEVERGLQAGFFRYLTKPINIDEFMKTQGMALKFIDEQANARNKEPKLQ